jgi:hypothetical protein
LAEVTAEIEQLLREEEEEQQQQLSPAPQQEPPAPPDLSMVANWGKRKMPERQQAAPRSYDI